MDRDYLLVTIVPKIIFVRNVKRCVADWDGYRYFKNLIGVVNKKESGL